MKTKEELNVFKSEVETVSSKLAELSEDELKEVTGGNTRSSEPCPKLSANRDFETCSLSEKGTLSDCKLCELSAGRTSYSPGN